MKNNNSNSPARHLAFEGTPNFRDYGGYETADGRRVKWRSLFRSGQLSALTASDQALFSSLGIRLVFDFRQETERDKEPSLLPVEGEHSIIELPITPGSSIGFFEQIADGTLDGERLASFMCEINREFAIEHAPSYKAMFSSLLNEDRDSASLVHCTAGKDRTGFAAAMVLAAIGVPKHTIMQDYMLTAEYFSIDREIARVQKKYEWDGAGDALRPMLEVRESYLQAAFDAISTSFSDLDAYLHEVLGLGKAECDDLKAKYLQ